jgi:transglutaminase-like putative cysteine protease
MVSIWQSEKARLADFHISATALERAAGIPCPPIFGLAGMECQPASMNCL